MKSEAAERPAERGLAASAVDPMKLTKTKGSNQTLESGNCCLCRRYDEIQQELGRILKKLEDQVCCFYTRDGL